MRFTLFDGKFRLQITIHGSESGSGCGSCLKINSLIIRRDGVAVVVAAPLTFSNATLKVQAYEIMKNMQKGKKQKKKKIQAVCQTVHQSVGGM